MLYFLFIPKGYFFPDVKFAESFQFCFSLLGLSGTTGPERGGGISQSGPLGISPWKRSAAGFSYLGLFQCLGGEGKSQATWTHSLPWLGHFLWLSSNFSSTWPPHVSGRTSRISACSVYETFWIRALIVTGSLFLPNLPGVPGEENYRNKEAS